jgi:succinyl-diaminopimelate desuccinylase
MTMETGWVDGAIDSEEAAALTADLVACRSYPGEEAGVQRLVAEWLDAAGLAAEQEETREPNRPNVLATIDNGPGPTLLLNGHVDTVLAVEGWSSDPWRARREGDRLYGLGACDMKSGVAATLLAARALARRRDLWRGRLIFSSVVDEEAYSIGARALIESGVRADACIVAESSWDRPCLGSVGKILLRLDVAGRAAHASWPAAGVNAAVEAARVLARLDQLPMADHPRMTASQCVLSFHSGAEQYVITVPELARVVINRMTVPGETAEAIVRQWRDLIDGIDSPARFTISVDPPFYPPWETAPDHSLARSLARAYERETGQPPEWGYAGFGDANLFSGEAGIPTVQIGPRGANFHQANEWVDVPSIAASARLYVRIALDLLQ